MPRSHPCAGEGIEQGRKPPVHAAIVVLNETRAMPCMSSAESVLPGLNPYQPNQRIKPPTAPRMMLWGRGGPPPSRRNMRPSRGPSAMAPISEIAPPMLCTTVEPAKSRNGVVIVASQPSGPQAQWPTIGAMKPVTPML